jgi:hypothetical protein
MTRMTKLTQLGPGTEAEALEFCSRHPDRTVALAGWLSDGGLRRSDRASKAWMFAEFDDDGRVCGLVYLSDTGIVIPVLSQATGIRAFADLGIRNPHVIRVVVAERWVSEALLRYWVPRGFRVRLTRDQLAYTVLRDGFRTSGDPLPLVPAALEHLDEVVHASAEMAKEEAGDDPQGRNPRLFRNRIRDRLLRGRDLIYREADRLKFKSNVAYLSPFGGQVEGIYVPPSDRGLGLGRRGTEAVTRWILERSPRACLLVNDDNVAAQRLYQRMGYQEVYLSRTTFFS